ncbi:MAG: hypothetical protein ACE3JP_03650 [Ectobacillus sp.]
MKRDIAIDGIAKDVNLSPDEFWELLVWWIESNGWSFEGTTKEVEEAE